jgi:nicotine blue oxidoreductase
MSDATSDDRRGAPDANGPPAGILLAAGGGSRLGGPKALVPFHGELLVHRGIRLLVAGGCEPVVVVVGAAADRVTAAVRATRGRRSVTSDPRGGGQVEVEVVENAGWREGMGASLRAGLAAVGRRGAPAAVIALVDQPLVAPAAVKRLVDAWRDGAAIAVATYAGTPRNPVLFDAATWQAVQASALGDRGGRALLQQRSEWVRRVACDEVASPRDIDTADDLRDLGAEPDPNPVAGGHGPAAKEQSWN